MSTVKHFAAAVLVMVLAGCTSPVAATPPVESVVTRVMESHPPVASFAAVGDSITSWSPAYRLDPAQSWVTTAGQELPLVGGWARPGVKLATMLQNVQPAHDARFLVLMGGTNDIFYGTPIPERLATVDAIVEKVGAEYALVAMVPPFDQFGAEALEWNAALMAHAQERGWGVLDPWSTVRSAAGTYIVGASLPDGVHPTPATAAIYVQVIRDTLRTAGEATRIAA